MTFATEILLLIAAILMLASLLASKVSERFSVPALLLFLLIGMLAGSEGFGGICLDNYQAARFIGVVALIFILFYGGLDTVWSSIKPVLFPGIILATFGVLVTAVVVGVAAVYILKFSLVEGLLLGSIVSSTDAPAVFSILRSKKVSLKGELKPLLEFESSSNDPMAVFLTVGFLGILLGEHSSLLSLLPAFALDMGIGVIAGYLMAKAGLAIINRMKLEYAGLYPVLTISLVLLTYAITSFARGNGFLAVYLMGLLMNKNEFVHKKSLKGFHEALAWLMQITMFLTLGLLVFPSELMRVFAPGLLITAILMFAARPIATFLCLIPFKFRPLSQIMVSWVGVRGAVPIILGTFPLLLGAPRSHVIFNVVFFVVLASMLLQGTSLPYVARFLKVDAPLHPKKRRPIEFEMHEGIDARLNDMIVPFGSKAAGIPLMKLGIPPKALIILVTRKEHFFIPDGSTALQDGDVLLVLANDDDSRKMHAIMNQLK
jgi:cell volume regulation protein A